MTLEQCRRRQISGGFPALRETTNVGTHGVRYRTLAVRTRGEPGCHHRPENENDRTAKLTRRGAGLRADELAYDARTGYFLAVNNADGAVCTLIQGRLAQRSAHGSEKLVLTDPATTRRKAFCPGNGNQWREQPLGAAYWAFYPLIRRIKWARWHGTPAPCTHKSHDGA